MPYILRKAARDLGVTVLGVVLLFVGTNIVPIGPDVGLDQTTAGLIAAVSLAAYRKLREQSDTLQDVDGRGA